MFFGLAALMLAFCVLYFWFYGSMVARIFVFLTLSAAACIMALVANIPGYPTAYLVLGIPLAWVIASIPAWVWRRMTRDASFIVPYPR